MESLVNALSEKLQPVSWALDRLILEDELKSASRDWEMTFDGIVEPIAILDSDGHLLRSNSHWLDEILAPVLAEQTQVVSGQQVFVVGRFPILMQGARSDSGFVVDLRDHTRSLKLIIQALQF